MNCDQLSTLFYHFPETRNFFRGCFILKSNTSITIKKALNENTTNLFVLLVNINQDNVGHFVLIWSAGKQLTFFDSYDGRNVHSFGPKLDKLLNSLPYHDITSNRRPLQGSTSCMCSLYVLLVGSLLCRGYTMVHISSLFRCKDLNFNDYSVLCWYKKKMKNKVTIRSERALLMCRNL